MYLRFWIFIPFLLLTSTLFGQPTNDDCQNAIPLRAVNGGCFFNATLLQATTSLPAANCNSALVQDIWFSFVADSTFHTVSVSPSAGMDAVLEIRKGANCEGQFIACIDEGGGNGAVENLSLDSLEVGATYLIRVYDFTGVGNPPSTWNLDICVSGFAPTEPPTITLIAPKGGQIFEAGSVLAIEAAVEGVISGKELEFSQDGGQNWEVIWQSLSPNPQFRYDWVAPSISSDNCLIRATVFQNGEAFEAQNDSTFSISTNETPLFALSKTVSHLYWPFYNSDLVLDGPLHVPSTWQNQEEGVLITKDDVVNTWFFFNDHYWQSSGRWHHSGHNCFAQDWNFINGGNSDCQMHFFSPMAGKILFQKNSCLNSNCNNPTCTSGCGNYFVVQSTEDPTFAYRACHFSELNTEYVVGDEINAGDWMALVGNEGSSTAAHVHFVLYKNLAEQDIERLASGNTLASNRDRSIDPANLSDLCFDKAANFRFDVPLNRTVTNISTVAYQPVHKLTVFPNPSDGQFNFRLNADAQQFMRLQVFDVMGRLVKDERRERYKAGETVHLNIGEATGSMYLLRVRFDQEVVMEKILIRK